MSQKEQSFENHAKWVPAFHFFLLPVFLANFVGAIYQMRYGFTFASFMHVLVAAALIVLTLLARIFALKAQDRVIRLEERLRLMQLAPAELRPRVMEIGAEELIGLRFASDEEAPELAQWILDGKLRGRKAVKKQVKKWRADHFRL